MKPRSLLLPVETRAREFDAKLLLALHAAERGWQVVIGERHMLHYSLPRFPRSVYFSKGFRSGNRKLFPVIAGLGHRIVALDEEALLRMTDDIFRLKMDPVVLGCVEAIFAWGEDDARLYRDIPVLKELRIEATGNPRIDIMRQELRGYFAPAIEDLRRRFGRFALLNSNFAIANHFIPEQTRFKVAADTDEDLFETLKGGAIGHKRALLNAFLAALPRLAAAAAPLNLVVRPHPSENMTVWQEAARGVPNLHVLHEGSVIPWLAAEVLLHNGCTSAVEASVIGTPALTFRPVKSDQFDLMLANAVSRECTSVEALAGEMRKVLDGAVDASESEARRQRRALLGEHIANLDGPLACERLLDVLEDLWRRPAPRMARAHAPLVARFQQMLARRRHERTRGEGVQSKKAAYTLHKFPPIGEAEVRARATGFGAAMNRFGNVTVKEIGKNLFAVQTA
jgi:surface carbohydrate biosynthesis protein